MFEEKQGLLNELRDCRVHDLRSPVYLFVSSMHSRSIMSLTISEIPKGQCVARLRVAVWDHAGQDDEEVGNTEMSLLSREWKIFLHLITFRLAYVLSGLGLAFFEIIVCIFACLPFGFGVLIFSLDIRFFVFVFYLKDTSSSNANVASCGCIRNTDPT